MDMAMAHLRLLELLVLAMTLLLFGVAVAMFVSGLVARAAGRFGPYDAAHHASQKTQQDDQGKETTQ